MLKQDNNYAFIDGQNLNLGIKGLGWGLDFKKFRIYLREKYSVRKAYYFIGFVPGNSDLYATLQNYGYILIFKPTFRNVDGKIKGNCDAELVLQAMIDFNSYQKAVIVSGDGDFYCLVKYLREKDKLKIVLAPDKNRYSGLLKKAAAANLAFMNDLRNKLEYLKEKTP
ncbi:MAG: NYN domain-containing protein [Bacteroidota bacterium]